MGTCQYVSFDPEPIYPSDVPETSSVPVVTNATPDDSHLAKDGSGFVGTPTRKVRKLSIDCSTKNE